MTLRQQLQADYSVQYTIDHGAHHATLSSSTYLHNTEG